MTISKMCIFFTFLIGWLLMFYCGNVALLSERFEITADLIVDETEYNDYDMISWLYGYETVFQLSESQVRNGNGNAEDDISLPAGSGIDDSKTTKFHNAKKSHQLIADSVSNIYNVVKEDDHNFRFDLIFDAEDMPDLTSMDYICPSECNTCNTSSAGMLCRACCPEFFSEPFSTIELSTLYNYLVDTVMRAGLAPVTNSMIMNDGRIVRAEVKAMIKRFELLNQQESTSRIALQHEDMNFGREWDRDFTFNPSQVCGYYEYAKPRGRIMGGTEVLGTRQYPWQMSLSTGSSTMFYHHLCGAVLISDKWALTAAHCVYSMRHSFKRRSNRKKLYVMGGFVEMSDRNAAHIVEVEDFIIHRRFVPKLYEQDIALLRLKRRLVYTPSLLPVCLPRPTFGSSQGHSRNIGRIATLTGWGRKWNNGPFSKQLEMVELPIISNSMCMDWYKRSGSRQFIPESTFLCAGREDGGMDACSGDSGGPLVIPRHDGRAEVVGLVSWGVGCGGKGRPGVFTRVSEFVPWIEKTIDEYESSLRNIALPSR